MPPQQCSCPWCGEDFKSRNKLKEHIRNAHQWQLRIPFPEYPEEYPETAREIASLVAQGRPPSLETKDVLSRLENSLTDCDDSLWQDFRTFFEFYKKEHF